MNDENSLVDREIKENRDLSVLLSKWQPPVFPAGLDARMTEASLRTGMRPPLWKRLLAARIPVPAPVAVLTIVLLSATTFLAVRTHKPLAAPVPAITVQTRPEILVTPPIVAKSVKPLRQRIPARRTCRRKPTRGRLMSPMPI